MIHRVHGDRGRSSVSFELLLIGILGLIFLAQWLDGLDSDRRKAREAQQKQALAMAESILWQKSLDDLLKKLKDTPLDGKLHGDVLKSMALQTDSKNTGKAYGAVLDALAANPTEARQLKKLCLQAGRVHYGKVRGGSCTIEDEQKIMNDIEVRL